MDLDSLMKTRRMRLNMAVRSDASTLSELQIKIESKKQQGGLHLGFGGTMYLIM